MVLYEMMLNYSHELLSNPTQFAAQYNDLYTSHQSEFDVVF